MFRRSLLAASLVGAFAMFAPRWVPPVTTPEHNCSGRGRSGGKGRGRLGARKPFHKPAHAKRCAGKAARRRRRQLHLRRG